MTNYEAIRFEDSRVPETFGKYKGIKVYMVPADYFTGLFEPNEWMDEVERYVLSKRFQKRLKEEQE